MKIKHLLLLLASAAFVALSCEKNNENKPDEKDTTPVPEISVLTTAFPSIADEGGTLKVTISSNVDWTLSVPESASWLSADPVSGAAGEEITITFTAEANDTPDRRTATVTVSAENKKGSDSEEFTVSQQQKDAILLTEDVLEVSYEGETINITVKANVEVSYTIAEAAQSWIVPVEPSNAPTRAMVDFTYQFEVLANPNHEEREGVITFTSAAGDETVTVKQEALPEPDPELAITPASISDAETDGAVVKLALTSNMPWTVSIPDGVNWLTVSPTQGEAGENIEVAVTIQSNDANDGRATNLTFTCTNAENESKDVVIKVSQKGHNISNKVVINEAADLVKFATDYNKKFYDLVLDSLTVTLSNDISFDAESSAAYDATGGIGNKIGEESNYFHGVFDGAHFTIKGLSANVPLFAFIGTEGTVKNLTIDNSCSFSFTHPNNAEGWFGSVVGYHKGQIDSVYSAADITLAAVENVSYMTTLGGLVGRATTGTVKNSEYSGLISTSNGFTSTGKLIIGGLVGRFSNDGSVTGSCFKGAISNEAQISSTSTSSPYTIIGGVVGHLGGGASIVSCSTTAAHAAVAGSYSGSSGIIVHKSAVAYYSAVGGIVGEVDSAAVSSCTNGATIMNTVFRQQDSDNTKARYLKTGGIAGKNNAKGKITGCINNAAVSHRSNPRLQSLGGIVGFNLAGGTVNDCTNNGEVAHMTTGIDGGAKLYGGRLVKVGGVIGENSSSNVTNVHNTATLTVSRTEAKAANAVDVNIGGVIGANDAEIDGGAGKTITNTGKVYYNTNMSAAPIDYCLGGIVGLSSASVKNAVNSGYVLFNWSANAATKVYLGGIVGFMNGNGTISGCNNVKGSAANSGEVSLYLNVQAAHKNDYAGGILGYSEADVTISDCNNSGYVHGAPNKSHDMTDSNLSLGGIAGGLFGKSTVSGCTNTGVTNLNALNNTDDDYTKIFADGGIVGVAKGTDTKHITITGCNWTYATDVGSRRGTCGGVAAYAEYTDVSDCDVTVDFNMYNHVTGGICGWAVNSTFTNCKFKGKKIASTQGYVSGGVVGKLDAGSVINGCYNYCKDITATKAPTVIGEIAATSVDGTTIKNSHYTGTIAICSDSNFTDDGSNAADLE